MTVYLPPEWQRFVADSARQRSRMEPRPDLRPDYWLRNYSVSAALRLAFDLDALPDRVKLHTTNNPALGLLLPARLVDPPGAANRLLVLAQYIQPDYVVLSGWIREQTARDRYTPRMVEGRGPLVHVVPRNRLNEMRDLPVKDRRAEGLPA